MVRAAGKGSNNPTVPAPSRVSAPFIAARLRTRPEVSADGAMARVNQETARRLGQPKLSCGDPRPLDQGSPAVGAGRKDVSGQAGPRPRRPLVGATRRGDDQAHDTRGQAVLLIKDLAEGRPMLKVGGACAIVAARVAVPLANLDQAAPASRELAGKFDVVPVIGAERPSPTLCPRAWTPGDADFDLRAPRSIGVAEQHAADLESIAARSCFLDDAGSRLRREPDLDLAQTAAQLVCWTLGYHLRVRAQSPCGPWVRYGAPRTASFETGLDGFIPGIGGA